MEQLHEIIAAIRSRWWLFAAIYSLPICSVVVSSLLFREDLRSALVLVGAFIVLSGIFHRLSTGISMTNRGIVFRSENPSRFWTDVTTLAVVYVLVTLWPIGYALQEANRQQAPLPSSSAPAPNPPKP